MAITRHAISSGSGIALAAVRNLLQQFDADGQPLEPDYGGLSAANSVERLSGVMTEVLASWTARHMESTHS
jgi:hypothetical protein